MACVDNNAFEIEITPNHSRKRKRNTIVADYQNQTTTTTSASAQAVTGLSNKGFSSTEINKFQSKRTNLSNNYKASYVKENHRFSSGMDMEVKSIVELAAAAASKIKKTEKENTENPYEVVRKPPKKKKKEIDNNEVKCFVNEALNLEVPDNKFNPFEVKRISPPKDPKESNPSCFINPGLNIRAEDNVLNPYEITRTKIIESQQNGIENPALEMPKILSLGIPFTPNIGCRINFENIALDSLTPSKLLAEKLTFMVTNPRVASLKLNDKDQFQRSLSIISEETVDIGRELDCYQLELENSINEAKLRKTCDVNTNLTTNLGNIKESVDEKRKEKEMLKNIANISGIDFITEENDPKTPKIEVETIIDEKIIEKSNNKGISIEIENSEKTDREFDEAVEKENSFEDSFDDLDFKAPSQFVRAYRKPTGSLTTAQLPKPVDTESKSKTSQVTNAIRKSIRKLIHPNNSNKTNKDKSDTKSISGESQKSNPDSTTIFQSIRHSFRRKPNKEMHQVCVIDEEKKSDNIENQMNATLTERQIFRSVTTEYTVVENKISLRSSLRKSTKGIKNHVMKSVFKKNIEEYQFSK